MNKTIVTNSNHKSNFEDRAIKIITSNGQNKCSVGTVYLYKRPTNKTIALIELLKKGIVKILKVKGNVVYFEIVSFNPSLS